MKDATFELHKWNSNCPELEGTRDVNKCEDRSFAKQQFQVSPNESSLLGLNWDKAADRLSVVFPRNECGTTKREVLRQMAKVYDPLGLASPTTLLGKLIFRDICDSKIAWDTPLTKELRRRWERYEHSLPQQVSTPRPLAPHHQPTTSVELHAFGDASINGVGTAVYSFSCAPGKRNNSNACSSKIQTREERIDRAEIGARQRSHGHQFGHEC